MSPCKRPAFYLKEIEYGNQQKTPLSSPSAALATTENNYAWASKYNTFLYHVNNACQPVSAGVEN